jgi:predicted metal-dependent hydrolase
MSCIFSDNEMFLVNTTDYYAKQLKKEVTIGFKENVKYTAICYKDKNLIIYNYDKINAIPEEGLRQLAIHEVCHLRHADHSKRFRNLCKRMGITEKYWLYGAPIKCERPEYMKT